MSNPEPPVVAVPDPAADPHDAPIPRAIALDSTPDTPAVAAPAPAGPVAAVAVVDPMVANLQLARLIAAALHGSLGALALLIGLGWALIPLAWFLLRGLSLLKMLTYVIEDPGMISYLPGDIIGLVTSTAIIALPSLLALPMGALGVATAWALYTRHRAQLVLGVLTVPQCLFLGILGWPVIAVTMAVLFHPAAKIEPAKAA